MSVILRPDVLLVMMASSGAASSTYLKIFCLSARSSLTASMIREAALQLPAKSLEPEISLAASAARPESTRLCSDSCLIFPQADQDCRVPSQGTAGGDPRTHHNHAQDRYSRFACH
jgi:hypothetical protein